MKKAKILLVESETVVAVEIENRLQRLGYDVTSIVDTGKKALEKAEMDKPDVVLMAVQINGEMDGIEAADIIRSRFKLPIVFSAVNADESRIERAGPAPPSAVVLKPVQERELKMAIEMALYVAKVDLERSEAEEQYRKKSKQMEEALKKKEQYYRNIFDNAPVGILKSRLSDGLIIEVNARAAKIMGLPIADIIGKVRTTDLYQNIEQREELRSQLSQRGEVNGFEIDRTLHDGREVTFALSAKAYPENDFMEVVVTDITEQKLAAKALRDSEEQYRKLINNSPDLIYRTDQAGNITFISKSVSALSGYSNEEAIGLNMAREVYLHPEERDRLLVELTKNGYVQNFEAELKRKDGSTWWASTNAHFMQDADGNVLGVEGITRDITESKQIETALRESEEKFKIIAEQSLMGISIFQDGVYKFVNNATALISEYSPEELMGWEAEEFAKLIHPDDVDFVLDQFRKKQAGEKDVITNYSYRGITKSGKVKWIEQYSESIQYQGKPADLVTVIDRTERKKAEQALKDSEEKYRTVVMNAVEAICVIQDARFKYFNPQTVSLFGYQEEELAQMSADEVVFPEDKELVVSRRQQRERGEPIAGTYSHRIVTKEGRVRWVEIKTVTITWNNRPAVLVFLTDTTERKQTEELMIQTEKMMSVGGLAAGMAHELNNPLGGILQGIQNIQRRLSPDLNSNYEPAKELGIDLHHLQQYMEKREILTFFDGIKNSGRKASEIISNMLQFSRKSESRKAPTNLIELMENVLELAGKDYDLKKKYDFRNIDVTKEFDSDLPLIPCTETEIEQVVLNLLNNAAYAMAKEGGKGPNCITIRLSIDQNAARVEIEDNGPGMDEATKKRIFEPFFTTKPLGEGTGLGLSVSYMIITNNHKGTMEVESEPGKGSTFIIRLPLGEA